MNSGRGSDDFNDQRTQKTQRTPDDSLMIEDEMVNSR